MGMYGQRCGAFSIVCDNAKEAAAVESQIKAVARAMYSNPPIHGALLVHEILSNPELKQQWCVLWRSLLRCVLHAQPVSGPRAGPSYFVVPSALVQRGAGSWYNLRPLLCACVCARRASPAPCQQCPGHPK